MGPTLKGPAVLGIYEIILYCGVYLSSILPKWQAKDLVSLPRGTRRRYKLSFRPELSRFLTSCAAAFTISIDSLSY